MMEQALQGGWRAIEWHCELLAHHRHRHIDGFDAAQDIRDQIAALEARGILAKGHLVVGRSVYVVKDRTRQTSPGQSPEIMEVVTVEQTHVFPLSRKPVASRAFRR